MLSGHISPFHYNCCWRSSICFHTHRSKWWNLKQIQNMNNMMKKVWQRGNNSRLYRYIQYNIFMSDSIILHYIKSNLRINEHQHIEQWDIGTICTIQRCVSQTLYFSMKLQDLMIVNINPFQSIYKYIRKGSSKTSADLYWMTWHHSSKFNNHQLPPWEPLLCSAKCPKYASFRGTIS